MLESKKPVEICASIAGWGYHKDKDGQHRGKDSILDDLKYAKSFNANLLLNTAPLPDGSIDKQDIQSLRAVGQEIRTNGWPVPGS